MNFIDRAGIFKAVPVAWRIKRAQSSRSVAISIRFRLAAQLDGDDWTDWSDYAETFVYGDFWVIKKDGSVNTRTVESLTYATGWNGDLRSVERGDPPYVLVQVTVKEEEYEGKTRFKAAWINHGDYSPAPESMDDADLSTLSSQFGSLLRAAAGAAAKGAPKPVPAPEAEEFDVPSREALADGDDEPLSVEGTPF